MKKIIKRTICLILAVFMLGSMTACNNNKGKDEMTCEVKVVMAGYDVSWLTEQIKVFNEIYQEEGYKVEITLVDTDIGLATEMTTPKRNTTDLYFEYTHRINKMLEKSRAVLGSNGGTLLEDVTDVLESKAVGTDKKEQGELIKDRIDEETLSLYKYTGSLRDYDGYYGVPCFGGAQGIYVNTKVLADKGYSVDDFLTTDSLISMTAALAPKGQDRFDATKFFPVSWAGGTGYWSYLVNILMAQYMGKDGFCDFLNFVPAEGESQKVASGYTVYENRGVYEALKVSEELQNRDYSVPGAANNSIIQAQARIFEGTSLYMVSGDWIYKEMEKDYSQYFNNVMPIKMPIISALGVKLGLCGTAHVEPKHNDDPFVDNYSCANCESKLKSVVKAIDAGIKTNAEIANEFNLTEGQVIKIKDARGCYEGSAGFAAMIPSYSNAKTVAKEFLKFMFSDEAIKIYNKETHADFIVDYTDKSIAAERDAKGKIMYDKIFGDNAIKVLPDSSDPIRVYNGLSIWPASGTDKNMYASISYSHTDYPNDNKAKEVYLNHIKQSKSNWGDWLSVAGLGD